MIRYEIEDRLHWLPQPIGPEFANLFPSMRPLVSIVTTVYNAEAYLDEAITSVVEQDFPDWEFQIVDDGSTDHSRSIAEKWTRRDHRIHSLHHADLRNQGISKSRNRGISESRGELIAFLDADDVWMPGKLSGQIEILAATPEAAMTFGAAQRWYSWNPLASVADFIVPSALPGWGSDRLVPPPVLLDAFLQDESLTPCTCAVLVRRSAMLRAGAFNDSFRGLYDDQVFYAKLALHDPVYVSSKCVARYRQHPLSCCAVARTSGIEATERDRFLSWLDDYRGACVRSR